VNKLVPTTTVVVNLLDFIPPSHLDNEDEYKAMQTLLTIMGPENFKIVGAGGDSSTRTLYFTFMDRFEAIKGEDMITDALMALKKGFDAGHEAITDHLDKVKKKHR
jgi:hypothetical protein